MPDTIPREVAWLNGNLIRSYHDFKRLHLLHDALVVARWILELADRYPGLYPSRLPHAELLSMLSQGKLPTILSPDGKE